MGTKEKFQGASASLFLAGSLLAGLYYFQPEIIETNSQETANNVDVSSLENKGYTVLSEEENNNQTELYEQLRDENKELSNKLNQLKNEQETSNQESSNSSEEALNNETIYQSILSIEQGMTSKDISSKLLELKVIDNTDLFEQKLSERGLEDRIQIGQYTLHSEMSLEDIITLITS
ncbi:hypothetical protein [Salipaludibacillus daqingensis]|uniref:hypothetical protein n=1 Tax=Salipaludibacillus daqingensis TaxID=3041001 RepID=UPI0024753719|nr:hypothetical protein [Salipaludibacillus daqingensis]